MARLEKYTRGASGHMMAHYDRSVGERNGNQEIKHELSELNYNLADSIQPKPQLEFIDQRLSEVKVQNRKDINIFCDWVVTAPKNLKDEDEEKFFKATFDLLTERYGKENVISAYVHKDETTPHIHFAFLPIVQDKKNPERKKLSAKECVNRTDLRTFHGHLNEYLKIALGYEVAILNGATSKGNKEIIQLKTETAQERLKEASQRLTEAHNEVSASKDELSTLKTELEPYRALETQKTAVEEQAKSFLGITTLKTKDFEQLKDQAMTYVANADPLEQAQNLLEENDQRKKELDNREKQLNDKKQQMQDHEKLIQIRHQQEIVYLQQQILDKEEKFKKEKLHLEDENEYLMRKVRLYEPPLEQGENIIYFDSVQKKFVWYEVLDNKICKGTFTAEVVKDAHENQAWFYENIQNNTDWQIASYEGNNKLYDEFRNEIISKKTKTELNEETKKNMIARADKELDLSTAVQTPNYTSKPKSNYRKRSTGYDMEF